MSRESVARMSRVEGREGAAARKDKGVGIAEG